MKKTFGKRLCESRWFSPVIVGLGIGWAMTVVLGPAWGIALGLIYTLVALIEGGRCRLARKQDGGDTES